VIAKPDTAPPKCAVCPILSLRLFIPNKVYNRYKRKENGEDGKVMYGIKN
jgi:hypothetical protein